MMISNRDQLASLIRFNGKAVELGVAAGDFSVAMLTYNPRFEVLYSIDRWSDHHDQAEEIAARRKLSVFGDRSVVIRSTFEEAQPMFPDEHFDFIYIDGYAHTGQEGGSTLDQWWPKLKRGGVFAGHDYHSLFPLTIAAVDDFIKLHQLQLNLTREQLFPSWWVDKA